MIMGSDDMPAWEERRPRVSTVPDKKYPREAIGEKIQNKKKTGKEREANECIT
jgi:hypothetical protein